MGAVQDNKETLRRVVEELPGDMVIPVLRLLELLRDSAQRHGLPPELVGDPQTLLQELQAGLADIEAGNLIDHAVVVRKVHAGFVGRVSPTVQAQLDAL